MGDGQGIGDAGVARRRPAGLNRPDAGSSRFSLAQLRQNGSSRFGDDVDPNLRLDLCVQMQINIVFANLADHSP